MGVSRRFNPVVEPQRLCIFQPGAAAVSEGKHRVSTWTHMVSQVVGEAERRVARGGQLLLDSGGTQAGSL